MEGAVILQLSSKTVGIFEAFYNSVKVRIHKAADFIGLQHKLTILCLFQPIQLVQYTVEVAPAGKIPSGKTEIPFELPLRPRGTKTLYETYHGVFVNIQYMIRCDIKRSFLAKDVSKSLEFIVEDKLVKKPDREPIKPVNFKVTSESLQNTRDRDRTSIPRFSITGKIDSLHCKLSEPLTGEVVIEHCEAIIKSIELQLVRVETCGCAEGYSKDGN